MKDLISIVVPVYNVAAYLSRCINSILKQDYPNIEVIAVDDGSDDDSIKVLERISAEDTRLRIITQNNQGVIAARLKGVSVSRGEWIGFVDGDDEVESDMYSRLLRNAIRNRADISHCGFQIFFSSETRFCYNTGRQVFQDHDRALIDLIEGSFIEPSLCTKLYRRSLFDACLEDCNDFSIKNYEDLLMNYYLFSRSQCSFYEDFCPYHYIKRENSATTSTPNRNFLCDPIKVLSIIKNDVNDEQLSEIVNKRLIRQMIQIVTMRSKSTIVKECKKKHLKQLRHVIPELFSQKLSVGFKVKVLFAAMVPAVYGTTHSIYKKLLPKQ